MSSHNLIQLVLHDTLHTAVFEQCKLIRIVNCSIKNYLISLIETFDNDPSSSAIDYRTKGKIEEHIVTATTETKKKSTESMMKTGI